MQSTKIFRIEVFFLWNNNSDSLLENKVEKQSVVSY
jgi:hypothetical protein